MASPGGGGAPTWFTPVRLLTIFCLMNMMIYIDRGVIASNGVNGAPDSPEKKGYGIQGDFGLSLFEDGLLPAAFMVGLLASSPVFAEASKRYNAFRLIGTGLAVWTAAVVGCGLSLGFVSLLLCRMAVGVGEASFVALASPFIDDNAPPDRKTRWLAIFYLCIPTGYALGYIYGGLVAAAVGWRAAFLMQGAAMVPFVAFCLRAPPIDIRGTHSKQHGGGEAAGQSHSRSEEGLLAGTGPQGEPALQGGAAGAAGGDPPAHAGRAKKLKAGLASVKEDLWALATHAVYVLVVGGMTCYTAVLGTFAFYGPKAGRDVFGIEPETADLAFGAITVVTGIFGTLAGGVLLDRIGSSMRNALLVCAAGTAAGCALIVLGFLAAHNFGGFAVALAAGEFAMFMTQAPSNAICMWSVPAGLRPFAMSMSVVVMHVLGDVPGPPLLGLLQGRLRNWRLSMSLCSSLLLLGAALYVVAVKAARSAVDYRTLVPLEEEEEEGEGGAGGGGADVEGGSSKGGRGWGSAGVGGADEEEGGPSRPGSAAGAGSGRLSPERPLLRGGQRSSDSLPEAKWD